MPPTQFGSNEFSDPAPQILDCQPERHRRVRRIWFGDSITDDPTTSTAHPRNPRNPR